MLQLHDGGVELAVDEILRQFEADESGPHHDHPPSGIPHGGVDPGLDPIDVFEIAERENPGGLDARHRRLERCGTRREEEDIVGFDVLATRVGVANVDRLRRPIDPRDRRASADVDPKPGPEPLGRRHDETLPSGDRFADVVGKPAIGK